MRKGAMLVLLAVLISASPLIAVAGVPPPGGTFFDDDGNVHEAAIEAIAAKGITKGCNPPQNTNYCPDSQVTRGQMAAFLVRALDLTETGGKDFVDDDGSVFENDIEKLAAAGVTKGCNPPANDRFCPNDSVTRGQMAAFLVRAFDYSAGSGSDLFIDDDGSTFENDIDRLGTAGITKGCNPPTNDKYCPNDPVLRDQMASFLSRALEFTNTTPPPRTDTALGPQINLFLIADSQGCSAIGSDSEDGILEECEESTSIASGEMFYVEHGWGEGDWTSLSAQEQAEFISDSRRFDLSINGFELSMFETFTVDGNSASDAFRFQFPGSLRVTTHELVGEWFANDVVELRITLHVTVNP